MSFDSYWLARQIAEARRSRLRLLDPQTPTSMWELLSKRKTLTIDAEDAKTELFRFEREMDVEAKDIQLVQQEKERAGHHYRSTLIAAQAVDGRLMTSSLTSEDVMARLVRTMRREHLTAQQLAEVMDENGDGTLSVQV